MTVDAFGTKLNPGDMVVYLDSGSRKMKHGEVMRVTPHGATITNYKDSNGKEWGLSRSSKMIFKPRVSPNE